MMGMGLTPVSAILPAKIDVIDGVLGFRAGARIFSWEVVKIAVTFNFIP